MKKVSNSLLVVLELNYYYYSILLMFDVTFPIQNL